MSKPHTPRISTLGSQLTAVISVSLVLFVLGLVALGGIIGNNISRDIRSELGFVVKAADGATDRDINEIKTRLMHAPYVASFVYSSAEDILQQESAAMGHDVAAMLEANPYCSEFDVKVTEEYASADSIMFLAAEYEMMPQVGSVVADTEVAQSVSTMLGRIELVLLVVAAALLVISFVLINNTVSLSIYSKRFLINTMTLVGATGAFIRRPFVLAGIASGLVSGVVASLACAALRFYAGSIDPALPDMLPWIDMLWITLGLLAAGILICGVSAAIATGRYLRTSYDDMFRK